MNIRSLSIHWTKPSPLVLLITTVVVMFVALSVAAWISASNTDRGLHELRTDTLSQSTTSNDSAIAAAVVLYEFEKFIKTGDSDELERRVSVLKTQLGIGITNIEGPAAEHVLNGHAIFNEIEPALRQVVSGDLDPVLINTVRTGMETVRIETKRAADKWLTETLTGQFDRTQDLHEFQQLLFRTLTPLGIIAAVGSFFLGVRAIGRARLLAANIELQEINAIKTQFVSQVSHELITPLTSVIAFTDLLNRNTTGNLTDRQINQLGLVKRNSEYLRLLIEDLVDVTRAESDTISLEVREVDIADLLTNLERSFGPIVSRKDQVLTIGSTGGLPAVQADGLRILQVLSNVVANASKYSPAATNIYVETRVTTDSVNITITDEGPGISDADKPLVFDMFYRGSSEATHEQSGTGIGLAVSKSIMDAHGGTIFLTDGERGGTAVTVVIPINTEIPSISVS